MTPRDSGYAMGDAMRERGELVAHPDRAAYAPKPMPFPWSIGIFGAMIGALASVGVSALRRYWLSRKK